MWVIEKCSDVRYQMPLFLQLFDLLPVHETFSLVPQFTIAFLYMWYVLRLIWLCMCVWVDTDGTYLMNEYFSIYGFKDQNNTYHFVSYAPYRQSWCGQYIIIKKLLITAAIQSQKGTHTNTLYIFTIIHHESYIETYWLGLDRASASYIFSFSTGSLLYYTLKPLIIVQYLKK